MRTFLTGGTGFIGGEVARRLRDRGEEVVALVRTPVRAERLTAIGCELVQGHLSDAYVIRRAIEGCDSVIHAAGAYDIGVRAKSRPAMYATNVTGTETVLRAALACHVSRAVYVSTVVAFGNTRDAVVAEGHAHDRAWTSYYDETKHEAHQVARRIAAEGLPLVTVLPGLVYGPYDHSQVGNLMTQLRKGRLPLIAFGDLGVSAVHRDDVADGILAALEKGRPGEEYVLGGDIVRLRDILNTAADVLGRKRPRGDLPTGVVRGIAPVGGVVGPLLGYPPNIHEVITASDGVTYWATSDKAKAELGYDPRPLAQGLRDTFAAEGVLSAF
jgi:nucleoside-diphosphate-sugar epimerase